MTERVSNALFYFLSCVIHREKQWHMTWHDWKSADRFCLWFLDCHDLFLTLALAGSVNTRSIQANEGRSVGGWASRWWGLGLFSLAILFSFVCVRACVHACLHACFSIFSIRVWGPVHRHMRKRGRGESEGSHSASNCPACHLSLSFRISSDLLWTATMTVPRYHASSSPQPWIEK